MKKFKGGLSRFVYLGLLGVLVLLIPVASISIVGVYGQDTDGKGARGEETSFTCVDSMTFNNANHCSFSEFIVNTPRAIVTALFLLFSSIVYAFVNAPVSFSLFAFMLLASFVAMTEVISRITWKYGLLLLNIMLIPMWVFLYSTVQDGIAIVAIPTFLIVWIISSSVLTSSAMYGIRHFKKKK